MGHISHDYDHIVKLLMLGDTAVGKTSLLKRFCHDKFDTSLPSTVGVDYKVTFLEQDGQKLKLELWDTAGQERFRTITSQFYRNANGVVFTFDVTHKRSFNQVLHWVQEFNTHATDGVQRILVGNKCDLNDKRKISEEEGQAFAAAHGMSYFETSAATGDGVKEAFHGLAKEVAAQKNLVEDEKKRGMKLKLKGKAEGGKCLC